MIRINLLPVKAAHRMSVGIRQLVLMVVVVVAVLVVMVGYNIKLSMDIGKKEEDIARISAEITRLEDLIGEVNELESDKKRLLKQLSVIQQLEKGKTGPVRMLDALATVIPKRIWIENMSVKSGALVLNGIGVENADISDFMSALEGSPLFSGVRLDHSTKASKQGQQVYRFSMKASVNYN